MIINPKVALEQKWIVFPETFSTDFVEKCIQPNGIDFTLDQLYMVDTFTPAYISEQLREYKPLAELTPDSSRNGEMFYTLHPQNCYDFMSSIKVFIPSGICARLEVRSTLNRVGVALSSGLYDTGFNGNIAGHLRPFSGTVRIAPNTRIGQIVFYSSVESSKYSGIYNNADEHWSQHVATEQAKQDENSN